MSKPSATLVGVFVLGALALIVVAVLFFGGTSFTEQRIPVVSFFPGSVQGLQVGAPVTFRGVRVGEVKSIGIRFNEDSTKSIVQVNMHLLPETVAVYGTRPASYEEIVAVFVKRGLTAQLVRQSFVTGLLNVDLDIRPNVEALRIGEATTAIQIPTVPGDLERITRRLEAVDIAAALESVQQTLASMNEILRSPEVTQTISELPGLVKSLRVAVNNVDREIAGLSRTSSAALSGSAAELQKTLATVRTLVSNLDREAAATFATARDTLAGASSTLASASGTLDGTSALIDPRGRTVVQLQRAIDDLAATAARLRNVAERVDRDPTVLIRGR